ncbi:RNA polymerase sigma factor [Pseudoalteromonas tunicata]|uniref:RNA polymerase sigma factor n=1 Tax=Pseudoalteromonas tunicata TaxID=314281 RepID=UPI00273FDDB5|nr:RNA polymerase sigma factor [Pseudoalteromonas tunicata]MDP4983753.1 RNA polymerase sigma factor [Pseudoalteromonas tunicata]MDP5214277.1 RNA polymerase sigma factor [Pseudoalteromonas tunicata]
MFFQSEQGLIHKAKQGNKKAWFKLVKQHESVIYHYCLRMLGNQEDAIDLMQEVFLSIYKSLDSFRFDSSFKTWIICIANRRCIEFYRKRKIELHNEEEMDSFIDVQNQNPEQQLQGSQHNQHVIAAMNTLSVEQRSVIELKFFHHYTLEQIGELQNISTNTVKSRFYAALENLKPHLEA